MWRSIAIGVVLAGIAVGCDAGAVDGGGNGAGSCAAILHWQGRTYWGVGTAIIPREEVRLGTGRFPACDDTGGTVNSKGPPQDVAVYRIEGVAPRQGVLTDTGVFVLDASHPPAAVRALIHAPRCTPKRSGSVVAVWGGTETKHRAQFDGDIGHPPYRLELFVQSGPTALLRANIVADVTASTRGILTPVDVKHVLWTGGTLALQLRCSANGGYQVLRIGRGLPGSQ
jgi:Family of unknown function (DUF6281)